MKAKTKIGLAAVLLLAASVVAQVVIGWQTGRKAALMWEAPTTNADGTPLTDLGGYRAAITPMDVDLNVLGAPAPLATANVPSSDTTQVALATMLDGRAAGGYLLWVLAYDTSGNESEWGGPLAIEYDPTAPGKPINIQLRK